MLFEEEQNTSDNGVIPSNSNYHVAEQKLEDYIIAFGYVYIQTAICAVGLLLNLINFTVFIQPKFTAPAYIVMRYVSLADAITLGLRIPQGYLFMPKLTGSSNDMVLFIYVYNMFVETPVTNMTENISAWLTVVLAIERYVAMKHLQMSRQYLSPTKIKRLVYIICLVAILFNTPYFALQTVSIYRMNSTLELYSSMTPFSQSNYYAVYSWLRIVQVQIIPFCFLCISNCLLFSLVSKHNQKFRKDTLSKFVQLDRSKSEKELAISESGNYNHHQNDQTACSIIMLDDDAPSKVHTDLSANVTDPMLMMNARSSVDSNNSQVPVSKTRPSKTRRRDHFKRRYTKSYSSKTSIDRSQKRRSAQTKLTILLIAVILLFLVGQVPQSIAYIRVFTTLGLCTIEQVEYCTSHRFYRMISVNMAQLAFASTFFVYIFLNRDFRNTVVIQVTECCCCRCSRRCCYPKRCEKMDSFELRNF